MKFVIKNYVKTLHGENLYATFTYSVKDISEANGEVVKLIELVRSVDSRMKGSAKVMKLLEVLSEIDKRKEYDTVVIKVLSNDMAKEESEANCVAKINWWVDAKKLIDEEPIDFTNSTCDISGLFNKIPLNEFEKYAKEIPDSCFDEDAGIVFSAKFDQRKENGK